MIEGKGKWKKNKKESPVATLENVHVANAVFAYAQKS